jgi:HSP20 family protein
VDGPIKPSVDLDTIDNGKTAIATFELPGVQKSDVKIEVHDCVLTISGEKKMPSPRVKNLHSIHERHYGKFIRSLHLPKGVKLEEIQATMENGVLILTFPNHEHGLDVGQVSVS